MFLDRNARLSARVCGNVLNFPLYDADCSPAARECLAAGNIEGALAEWQRLADLGSGAARCVLAYVHLMGTSSIPANLEEARRIALSAVSGARGYANYLLGCIALRENQTAEGVKFLVESIKAGFMPAATHLVSITIRHASGTAKQNALKLLRRASAAGHRPANLRLAAVYLSGQLGFPRRAIGLALLLPAFLRTWAALRYQIFSIHCFQVLSDNSQPLFNEGIRNPQQRDSLANSAFRRTIVQWAHGFAAMAAAVVLAWQSKSFSRPDREVSVLALGGWGLLAAWPYAFSYLIASTTNIRTLISTLVQTMSLCLLTTLMCSAYSGQLFDAPLHGWDIAFATVAQAFFLVVACGLGESAARQWEVNDLEKRSGARDRILWLHVILGLVAAGSWFTRSEVGHWDYASRHGFELASFFLLAMLPYLAGAVLSWPIATASRRKRWAYVAILIVGTALAVLNNSGVWAMQPGLLGAWLVLIIQFILFIFAAEWAIEGLEG